ncbi:MAG: hypothetical protein AABX94_00715 [Nanoarchaeota archaeon]
MRARLLLVNENGMKIAGTTGTTEFKEIPEGKYEAKLVRELSTGRKIALAALAVTGLGCLAGLWEINSMEKYERHMNLPENIRKYDIDQDGYFDIREATIMLDSYRK